MCSDMFISANLQVLSDTKKYCEGHNNINPSSLDFDQVYHQVGGSKLPFGRIYTRTIETLRFHHSVSDIDTSRGSGGATSWGEEIHEEERVIGLAHLSR